jgi:hypothetical protein
MGLSIEADTLTVGQSLATIAAKTGGAVGVLIVSVRAATKRQVAAELALRGEEFARSCCGLT